MLDTAALAATVASIVAPFTPHLLEAAKSVTKDFAEIVAEKGGQAAWDLANGLWQRIVKATEGESEAEEVERYAEFVSTKPDDEKSVALFADSLAEILEEKPELAQELSDLLGQSERSQEVVAQSGSLIDGVTMRMRGSGHQSVKATDDAIVRNVIQEID